MTEERDELIVLIDENGEEVEFELVDTVELNDKEYVVLLPAEQADQKEESDVDEVVILRIEHEDEEDTFVTIEEDEEVNAVFEEFMSRMEEDFEN